MYAVTLAVLTPHGVVSPLVRLIAEYAKSGIIVVCDVKANDNYETKYYNVISGEWKSSPASIPFGSIYRVLGCGSSLEISSWQFGTGKYGSYSFDGKDWTRVANSRIIRDHVTPIRLSNGDYRYYSSRTNQVTLNATVGGGSSHESAGLVVAGNFLHIIGGFRLRNDQWVGVDTQLSNLQCSIVELSSSRHFDSKYRLSNLPYGICELACCVYRSMIVIACGNIIKDGYSHIDYSSNAVLTHPILPSGAADPDGSWSQDKISALRLVRSNATLLVADDVLYIVGGRGMPFERYDEVSRQWVEIVQHLFQSPNYAALVL
jgi:hypothetical protein